jgi:hypothetical protein
MSISENEHMDYKLVPPQYFFGFVSKKYQNGIKFIPKWRIRNEYE